MGREDAPDLDDAFADRGEVVVEREPVRVGQVRDDLVAVLAAPEPLRVCSPAPVRMVLSRRVRPVANGGSA